MGRTDRSRKYRNLQRRVTAFEQNPDREAGLALLRDLAGPAEGGRRYRALYNRVREALHRRPTSAAGKREKKPAQRTAEQRLEGMREAAPRGMVKSPKFTGGRELQGGLPGSRR